MKTAWVCRHVPFEGPGAIAPALAARGYRIRTLSWWERPDPPDLSRVDVVVAMGGPMSVNESGRYSWIDPEKNWLAAAMRAGIPVLGVCLGAQLMASALGAPVGPNPEREIGWFPVRPAASAPAVERMVLHWHGETFGLPEGAVHLEESDACRYQSFRWGDRAVGLQYHLETTSSSLEALIANCRDELAPGPYVQSEAELRAGWGRHHARARAELDRVLSDLLER